MKAGKESSLWTNGRQSVVAELLACWPSPLPPSPRASFGNACSDGAGCPSARPPLGRSLPAAAPGECWHRGPRDGSHHRPALRAVHSLTGEQSARPRARGKPSQRQEEHHPAGRSRFQPDRGGTSYERKQSKDLERAPRGQRSGSGRGGGCKGRANAGGTRAVVGGDDTKAEKI